MNNDPNELISVFKAPNVTSNGVEDNHLELLNMEELERCLYSKHPGIKKYFLNFYLYYLFQ